MTYHQKEIKQITPREGWVEQDPIEILESTKECINQTIENLKQLDIDPEDIVATGITNQRETTVVWDAETGLPLHNAIGECLRKKKAVPNELALMRSKLVSKIWIIEKFF